MTRLSTYLLPTEREAPADAKAVSHKLMVRAGLIRQIGAGLWTYLPAGMRVQHKIASIMREEMDSIGAQEILMPLLQPAELWDKTGRSAINELFKLRDRKDARMVLAMTHEESVTSHVASLVNSYRDLPLILYHLQLKERDEPRPRAGVLRTREFTMKDSYSFDLSPEGLDLSYQKHVEAYTKIFDRCGIKWYQVESDVGMMGGSVAHEYMAPCAAGENEVVLAGDYAANIEIASAEPPSVKPYILMDQPEEVDTPGKTTIEEIAELMDVAPGNVLKAYPVVAEKVGMVLVMVRGDHTVNEVKLRNYLKQDFRPARDEEIEAAIGPVGYIGSLNTAVSVVLDEAVDPNQCYICGANKANTHLSGVMPSRDFPFHRADIRTVQVGDTVNGIPITIETAIEIGNIFKLGTRYSEPLGATYLDSNGSEQLIWMGSYGIGPARIAAAAIEQFADKQGISWPKAIAPFTVHLVSLGAPDSEEGAAANLIYQELLAAGIETLYDDRDRGAGEKFKDAELLGCPLRVTVGKRSLKNGSVEVQIRRSAEQIELPLEGLGASVQELVTNLL